MPINHQSLCIVLSMTIMSFAGGSETCFNLLKYNPPAFSYHLLELTPDFSLNGQSKDYNKSYMNYYDSIVPESDNNNISNSRFAIYARHSWYGWKEKPSGKLITTFR